MNSTSSHPTKHHHQSCIGSPPSVSSTAPAASIEALKDSKISTLDMLRAQTASQRSYPSTALSSSTSVANADVVEGNDMQTRSILRTNCENCNTGTTLDPASCASVLARIVGSGEDRSRSTAADVNAGSREGTDTDMQGMLLPAKSETCEPGPTLNPASCASGLALIVEEGNDCDGVLDHQGNTHRRNSLLQNEDWSDIIQYPQGLGNLFLGDGDIIGLLSDNKSHVAAMPRKHVPNPNAASRRNSYASAAHQPSHAVNPYVATQQYSDVGDLYDSDSDRKLPARPTHSQLDDM